MQVNITPIRIILNTVLNTLKQTVVTHPYKPDGTFVAQPRFPKHNKTSVPAERQHWPQLIAQLSQRTALCPQDRIRTRTASLSIRAHRSAPLTASSHPLFFPQSPSPRLWSSGLLYLRHKCYSYKAFEV